MESTTRQLNAVSLLSVLTLSTVIRPVRYKGDIFVIVLMWMLGFMCVTTVKYLAWFVALNVCGCRQLCDLLQLKCCMFCFVAGAKHVIW